jgi:colanic acid/amylovoran biosynthesis glycosyltransferase
MSGHILKIAQSTQYWLGLTQNWIFNQLSNLNSIESFVLCYDTKNLNVFPWMSIYRASRLDFALFRLLRKYHISYRYTPKIFQNAIQSQQPMILHSHFGNRGWFDMPLVEKFSLKQVVTYYGYDVNRLPTQHPVWNKRYRELFEQVDLILCEGPHMASMIKQLGCPESKIRVQRIGIDLNNINFVPRKFKKGDQLKFLIASSFREKKGIPDALEAIGQFKQNYPNIKITLIGDASKEKSAKREKKRILSMIEKYDLVDKVTLMGYQPHSVLINEAFKHHIFLSPSATASDGDTEGGAPISIIEMMATGIPIVSTNHCDIPQIVIHGTTGLLANEHDIDGLVRNITWLVDNPKQWEAISMAGRDHIEENFDVRIQTKALKYIYESL